MPAESKPAQDIDENVVVPRDAAEAKAQEYEDGHHDRAGHNKQAPSGASKPHSVRTA
jgi:hypothetical protein